MSLIPGVKNLEQFLYDLIAILQDLRDDVHNLVVQLADDEDPQ